MDENAIDLVDWILQLDDRQTRRCLAYLSGYAPAVVREALTWLDSQTPPQYPDSPFFDSGIPTRTTASTD